LCPGSTFKCHCMTIVYVRACPPTTWKEHTGNGNSCRTPKLFLLRNMFEKDIFQVQKNKPVILVIASARKAEMFKINWAKTLGAASAFFILAASPLLNMYMSAQLGHYRGLHAFFPSQSKRCCCCLPFFACNFSMLLWVGLGLDFESRSAATNLGSCSISSNRPRDAIKSRGL
jgi:hypothetical protein